MSETLTDKQKAFCLEYLKDFNGTRAAIRAGYSENSANEIASENLAKPNVASYLNELKEKLNNDTENDIRKIIMELQLIAFGSLRDVSEWDAGGLSVRNSSELINGKDRLVSEISENRSEKSTTVKIKMHDKLKALELLGKYHKIFTDKTESETSSKHEVTLSYSLDD